MGGQSLQVRGFTKLLMILYQQWRKMEDCSTDEFWNDIRHKGLLSNTENMTIGMISMDNITNDWYNSLKDKKEKRNMSNSEANQQVASFAKEIGKGLIEALRKEHKL